MSKATFPPITSRDDAISLHKQLDREARDAAAEGSTRVRHFIERLHAAVDTIDASHDQTASSIGIDWIKRNTELFAMCVTRLSRLPFFASHMDSPHIGELLCDHKVVRLFGKETLTQLAIDIAKQHPLSGIDWITCLAYQGVDQDLLAAFVLDRLNNNGFTAEQTDQFVETYIVSGAGRVALDTMWPTDEHGNPHPHRDDRSAWTKAGDRLPEILSVCIKRRPDLFFKRIEDQLSLYEKLWAYRDFIDPRAFITEAAGNLTTLEGANITLLTDLSFETRGELVRRMLPGSLELLVDYLFSDQYLDEVGITIDPVEFTGWEATAPTDRAEFCETFRRLYWTIRSIAGTDFQQYLGDGATAPETVMEVLIGKMNSFGYVVGTLSEEFVERQGHRLFVSMPKGNGTIKYVYANPHTGKSLHKGGAVIIDLQVPAKQLSSRFEGGKRVTVVSTTMMSAFGS